MTSARLSIPQEQISEFCRRNGIRSLALFGSVLRPDFQPDSDVDVLVEFDSTARVGFMALGRMQRELEVVFQRPVDLIPREGLKPRIRQTVLDSSEVVYAG